MNAAAIRRILSAGTGTSLRARLVRGAMGVGGLKLASLPLSLAVSVFLARVLGPEGFGQYAFITSVVTVLSLPLDKGMYQLVTREVATYHHDENWALFRGLMRWAHLWVLLGSVMICAFLGALALYHAAWETRDRWTLLLVGLVMLPFVGLNALRGANLRGLGYVICAQIPELLVRPGFHLGGAVLMFGLGLLNPATALLGQVIATACAFLLGAYLLHQRRPPQLETAIPAYRNTEWAHAWIPFTLLMAASMLNNQIGILLLGWLGSDSLVAALRVADRGAQLVALSLGIVNLVIAPYITQAYREANLQQLQSLSRQSARAALGVALPIAVPLILFAGPIIGLIFGTEYVDIATGPLITIAFAQLVNVSFGSVGMFLMMTGAQRETLLSVTIGLLINLLSAGFLIPRYQAIGAAYSFALGLIGNNLMLALMVYKRLNIRPSIF